MATPQNFTIKSGDSETLAMTMTDYNGEAVNLATCTNLLANFKRVLSDPDANARIAKKLQITTLTITGTPNGGTFTITVGGQTTAGIAYNAIAPAVKTALELLSTVGSANSYVFGGPGPGTAFSLVLLNSAAGQVVSAGGASLTGGTTPAATAATAGTIAITDAANGHIKVPIAPGDTTGVQSILPLGYDAKVFLADGSETTGGTGILTVLAGYVQTT